MDKHDLYMNYKEKMAMDTHYHHWLVLFWQSKDI